LSDKILTLLGFCRKAGKLIIGTEKVTEALKQSKRCLVTVAEDISDKTFKELNFFASKGKGVVIKIPYDTFQVSKAIGTKAGVVATTDDGFSKAILEGGNN
jgi:ribosomal protein L7Ae-like RNA K-turn-binding protein